MKVSAAEKYKAGWAENVQNISRLETNENTKGYSDANHKRKK